MRTDGMTSGFLVSVYGFWSQWNERWGKLSVILNYTPQFTRVFVVPLSEPFRTDFTIRLRANDASFSLSSIPRAIHAFGWSEPFGPPNKALQLTANPLRGLSAAELCR